MSSELCIVFVTEKPTQPPDYDKTNTTDTTGASGKGVINSHAFTKQTLLEHKTVIITIQDYEDLEQIYKTKPYFNLFRFDIFDTEKRLSTDKSKLCCLIIFLNDVYSYHYVCAIDTIEETKQRFKNIIEKNNMGIKNYSLLKINFNEDGKFTASNDEPLY
jgi:hypothetical protein